MALHDPAVQRKVLQDEVTAITEEASEGEVEGLRKCVEMRSMSMSEASEEEMLS